MGVVERQQRVRAYRGQMPSPGRPTVAWHEGRVKFWAAIARGAKTEDVCGRTRVGTSSACRSSSRRSSC
ncbi:hypothetical protein F8144_38970 [Streptomyces triticiradicis]|uniref:Uncharacterized protein n=1 Tax=Streptomyces triticiradicis TaxID=2651189 RepID=A0A7J5D6C1_9ACTN|nr:hypothetical protein F8144_38970 [Streptomyces triticiradicis]